MDVCNKCCEINTVSSTFESLQVLPWNNETIIRKNECLEMMPSCDNKLLFLYACLKPRRYHNWYLWYLLATILALQKRSKSERMSGCNYSFTVKKAVHQADGCNWTCVLTQYLWKKRSTGYVKTVRIRSYSGPHFPVFALNAERYRVSVLI